MSNVCIIKSFFCYLKTRYNIENLYIIRRRNLLKIMFKQSLDDENSQGHCPTPTPDARYFASQWNIGLRVRKIQRSPSYRGVQLWNVLPSNVQNENNYKNKNDKDVMNRYKFETK